MTIYLVWYQSIAYGGGHHKEKIVGASTNFEKAKNFAKHYKTCGRAWVEELDVDEGA